MSDCKSQLGKDQSGSNILAREVVTVTDILKKAYGENFTRDFGSFNETNASVDLDVLSDRILQREGTEDEVGQADIDQMRRELHDTIHQMNTAFGFPVFKIAVTRSVEEDGSPGVETERLFFVKRYLTKKESQAIVDAHHNKKDVEIDTQNIGTSKYIKLTTDRMQKDFLKNETPILEAINTAYNALHKQLNIEKNKQTVSDENQRALDKVDVVGKGFKMHKQLSQVLMNENKVGMNLKKKAEALGSYLAYVNTLANGVGSGIRQIQIDEKAVNKYLEVHDLYELLAPHLGAIDAIRKELELGTGRNSSKSPITNTLEKLEARIKSINDIKRELAKKEATEELVKLYEPGYRIWKRKADKDIAYLERKLGESKEANNEGAIKNYESALARRKKEVEDLAPTKETIVSILEGERGDVHYIKTMIQASRDNKDLIVQGFGNLVARSERDSANEFQRPATALQKILNKAIETGALGNKSNTEKDYEEFVEIVETFGTDNLAEIPDTIEGINELVLALQSGDIETVAEKVGLRRNRQLRLVGEISPEFDKQRTFNKSFLRQIKAFRQKADNDGSKTDEYRGAMNRLFIMANSANNKFEFENVRKPYTQEYYENLNKLEVVIEGEYLAGMMKEIDDGIREMQEQIMSGNETPTSRSDIRKLRQEKFELGSIAAVERKYNAEREAARKGFEEDKANGVANAEELYETHLESINRKEDKYKKIAQVFHDYSEANYKMHQWVIPESSLKRWEREKKFHEKNGTFDQWSMNNIETSATTEFYEKRKSLIEQRARVEEEMKRLNGNPNVDFTSGKDIFRVLSELTSAYKVQGIINGKFFKGETEKVAEIKKLQKQLIFNMGLVEQILDLSPEYSQRTEQIAKLVEEKNELEYQQQIITDKEDLKAIKTRQRELRKSMNKLGQDNANEMRDQRQALRDSNREMYDLLTSYEKLSEQMRDLSKRITTEYYQEALDDALEEFAEQQDIQLEEDFEANGNRYFLEGKTWKKIKLDEQEQLATYLGPRENILSIYRRSKNFQDKFKAESEWYKNNHISNFFIAKNEESGKSYISKTFEPIYIWKHSKPRNQEHIDKEAPTFAWKQRKVRDGIINPEGIKEGGFINDEFNEEGDIDIKGNYKAIKHKRWLNPKYQNIANNPDKEAFVEGYRKEYHNFQLKYPESKRLGDVLPSKRKEFTLENMGHEWQGAKDTFNRFSEQFIKTKQDLTEGEAVSVDSKGKEAQRIPVLMSGPIEPEDNSNIFSQTILEYGRHAYRYEHLTNIDSTANALIETTGNNSIKNKDKEDATDQAHRRKLAEETASKLKIKGVIDSKAVNRRHEALIQMREMHILNQKKITVEQLDKLSIGDKAINVDKAFGTLLGWRSTVVMATLPWSAHAFATQGANLANGMLQMALMTGTNNEYSLKETARAYKKATKDLKSVFNDWHNSEAYSDNLGSQMMWYFGALESTLSDVTGERVRNKNALRKFLSRDFLFWLKNSVELTLATTTYRMVGEKYMVTIDGNRQVPIIEAYENTQGYPMEIGNIKFPTATQEEYDEYVEAREILRTSENLQDLQDAEHYIKQYKSTHEFLFSAKVADLQRNVNGNYGSLNQTLAQRHIVWRSLFWMKQFLLPMLRFRYGSLHYKFEAGGLRQGYYRTMIDAVDPRHLKGQGIVKMAMHTINTFTRPMHHDFLNEREIKDIKKVHNDIIIMTAVVSIAMLAVGFDDEDETVMVYNEYTNEWEKKKATAYNKMKARDHTLVGKALNTVANMLNKISSEYQSVNVVTGINEFNRVRNNLTSEMIPMFDQVLKVASSVYGGRYEKNGPTYRKGELKFFNELQKQILGMGTSKVGDFNMIEAIKIREGMKR